MHAFARKQCILCSALRHESYLTLPYVTYRLEIHSALELSRAVLSCYRLRRDCCTRGHVTSRCQGLFPPFFSHQPSGRARVTWINIIVPRNQMYVRQPVVIYRFIRAMRCWCGWKQNASILPVWRHSEYCIKNANFWRT